MSPVKHGCRFGSIALISSILLTGCGPSGSVTPGRSASGTTPGSAADGNGELSPVSTADVQRMIGEYMPPLEGGVLLIATPKGWDFSRAGNEYLVGFHPANASLNDLPRILVSAEEAPYAGIDNLDASNAEDFLLMLAATLGDEQLRSPATIVTLGGRTWTEHIALRKSRNALVARQVLQTAVGGRLYKINLEVFDRELSRYREAAYAVAASAEFSQEGGADNTPLPSLDSEPTTESESVDSTLEDTGS